MDDLLSETEILEPLAAPLAAPPPPAPWIIDMGETLERHNGQDVAVMDVRQTCDWTDFFIIATATSSAHLDGLERHVKEFCDNSGVDILRKSPRTAKAEDGWRIIDLGTEEQAAVVHLMTSASREFYDLERLWSAGGHKISGE